MRNFKTIWSSIIIIMVTTAILPSCKSTKQATENNSGKRFEEEVKSSVKAEIQKQKRQNRILKEFKINIVEENNKKVNRVAESVNRVFEGESLVFQIEVPKELYNQKLRCVIQHPSDDGFNYGKTIKEQVYNENNKSLEFRIKSTTGSIFIRFTNKTGDFYGISFLVEEITLKG